MHPGDAAAIVDGAGGDRRLVRMVVRVVVGVPVVMVVPVVVVMMVMFVVMGVAVIMGMIVSVVMALAGLDLALAASANRAHLVSPHGAGSGALAQMTRTVPRRAA